MVQSSAVPATPRQPVPICLRTVLDCRFDDWIIEQVPAAGSNRGVPSKAGDVSPYPGMIRISGADGALPGTSQLARSVQILTGRRVAPAALTPS